MPIQPSRRHALTLLLTPATLALTSCTLRLEDHYGGSVGQKAPSDQMPLARLTSRYRALQQAMPPGHDATIVRQQIDRLEATAKGLGATVSRGPRSSWPADANATIRDSALRDLSQLSAANAPLASLTAASLLAAAAPAHLTVQWPDDMTFPSAGAGNVVRASSEVIMALEWMAAHEKAGANKKKAETYARDLTPLYAVRNLAQQPRTGNATKSPQARTFTSTQQATSHVTDGLLALQSACAQAATTAHTPAQSAGVVFAWMTARRIAQQRGRKVSVFAGLTTS